MAISTGIPMESGVSVDRHSPLAIIIDREQILQLGLLQRFAKKS